MLKLQDNYRIAMKWFEGLKKRLKKNVTLYSRYTEVVEDCLQQDMSKDNASSADNVKYHLPLYVVL